MTAAATPALAYPPELPVSAHREELLEAIGAHQVVVVAGETGSGKTTQLPKLCLELGRERIAHTQPRRLAARTVAARIAEEMKVPLGETVGYAVRFRDRSSRDTQVRLMTDGLLLAEIRRDKLLRRYDTIIVDEAHERSLNIDFLLGYLRADAAAAARPEGDHHLGDDRPGALQPPLRRRAGGRGVAAARTRSRCATGRSRTPIATRRTRSPTPCEELLREGPGDVLVFLSGEREIRDTADVLRGRLGRRGPAAVRAAVGGRAAADLQAARRSGGWCWRRTSPRRR